jgi:hypothetical protein
VSAKDTKKMNEPVAIPELIRQAFAKCRIRYVLTA